MRILVRTCLLVLVAWLQLSGVSFAKQVFLQDGSVLDCQSFWKRGQQIVVKVNRDVVLEFDPSEVNLAKTFHQAKRKARVKRANHAVKHAVNPPVSSAATAVPATEPAARKTAPSQGKNAPAPAPAVAPKAAPAVAPAVKHPGAMPIPPHPSVAPAPAAVPAAKEDAKPEAEPAAAPAPPLSKEELERRTRENTELMTEAIRKKDPALMKKAIQAQKDLVQPQKAGQKNGKLKTEPPWFKYLLILGVSCLLILVGMWVVFQKAGQSGVKSLIPLYNYYVLMEISGKPGWWFILLLVPVVGVAILLLAMLSLAEKFGRSPVFGVGLTFLPMIFFPLLAFGGSQYGTRPEAMEFTFSEEPPLA